VQKALTVTKTLAIALVHAMNWISEMNFVNFCCFLLLRKRL